MKKKNFFIRLPFLKISAREEWNLPDTTCFFNPGLSLSKLGDLARFSCYTPIMPISEKQADKLLEEMLSMQSGNYSMLLHGINALSLARNMRQREEIAAIMDFAGEDSSREQAVAMANMVEHAQKMLLWHWAMEEMNLEISSLEQKIGNQEQELCAILSSETVSGKGRFQDNRNDVRQFQGNWRLLLQNISYFLPREAGIFVENEMAQDLSGQLEFSAMDERFEDVPSEWLNYPVKVAKASVFDVLASNGGIKMDASRIRFHKQNFSIKRWWIIRQ